MSLLSGEDYRSLWSRRGTHGLLVAITVMLLAAPGVLRYGLTWDEPTYFRFARLQRAWLGDVVNPATWADTFAPEKIQQVWLQHPKLNGHPPFTETWQAMGSIPFHLLGLHDTQAFRMAMTLLLGITAGLLFVLLRRQYSSPAALSGVLVYLGVPAVWAHGHLGATETPQLFFWVLFALITPPALDRGRGWLALWLAASVLSFATKFTNVLIPIWVLGTAALLGDYRNPRLWILAAFGFVVGPALLLVVDPLFWPWQGGWERYVDYWRQVTTRAAWAPLNVFYLGQSWGFSPPWHYRIVSLLAALPVASILLLLLGIMVGVRDTFRQFRRQSRTDWILALGITGLLGTLVMGWLPNSPNHDNVRQFVYVFVPVACLAAGGVQAVLGRLARRSQGARRPWLRGVVLVPALIAFAVSLRAEPWGLSYYSEWIGGTRGAAKAGFDVCYWGEGVTGEMLDAVGEIPSSSGGGARLFTFPKVNFFQDAEDFWRPLTRADSGGLTISDVLPAYYQPAGLPPELRNLDPGRLFVTFPGPVDGILIFYRRSEVQDRHIRLLETLEERGDLELVHETRIDGVPVARLYALRRLARVTAPGGDAWYAPRSAIPTPP